MGTRGKEGPGLVVQKSQTQRSLKPCLLTWVLGHSCLCTSGYQVCHLYAEDVPEESKLFSAQKPCPKCVLTNTSSPSLLSTPRKNPRPLLVSGMGKESLVLCNQDKNFSYGLFFGSFEHVNWLNSFKQTFMETLQYVRHPPYQTF